VINAGDGDDLVTIAAAVTRPATVTGGDGIDVITAGGGNSVLLGQNGNDVLLGGAGDDVIVGGDDADFLSGGNGRDVMIGGLGADFLSGQADEDVLIAARTTQDADRIALDQIRAIWSGSANYSTRGRTLKTRFCVSDQTLSTPVQTLFDDEVVDVLQGGNSRDWWIVNNDPGSTDILLDRASNETLTDTDPT
jgi:Ca2+-binding RTX toxin-like protein